MKVELQLLAGARAVRPGGKTVVLERKTAALLAVLALEQSTSRSRAACLLWPEVPDSTARANLRQLLRRLRLAVGIQVVDGGDPLRLGCAVALDLRRSTEAGELLAGYEYDDCAELSEWLLVRREQCRLAQCSAFLEAIDQLTSQGQFAAALDLARRITSVHPDWEPGRQAVGRLCRLLGARAVRPRVTRQSRPVRTLLNPDDL